MRVGESTLSIYHAGERIATHHLLPAYVKNGYSTDESHMPEAFLKPEWDDARIKGWAKRIGPNCGAVIDRIFDRVKVKEQACNPSLSILRLSGKYGDDRLEAACAHALPRPSSPRYKHIKAILDSNLDAERGPELRKRPGAGGPRGHLKKYARYEILVLDEWLTEDVDDIDIAFLFELVERRYAAKSTVLCTQYTPAEWHGRLGGGVRADALVDRLVHGAIRIDLGDVNVRKLLSEKK